MVYSVSASSMFSIDDNGKHSLEVAYKDSDGVDVGAYSEGDNLDEVLGNVLDQIDAAIADAGDARADAEEAAQLQAQINDLTQQLEELKLRNAQLEKKNDRYKKYHDFEETLNKICKEDDLWKRWFK